VRAAGAEGFGPALSGADAEDAGQDEDIGNKDCYAGGYNVESSYKKDNDLHIIGARAGELHKRENVTKVVADEDLTIAQI
jgi:hypothetical protein